MYLTTAQTLALLTAEGHDTVWQALSADEQVDAVNSASRRMEAVPFAYPYASRPNVPRFTDGKVANANGDPIPTQDMPRDLQQATALLALHISGKMDFDKTLLGIERGSRGLTINAFLADLPVTVASVLWKYMDEDARDSDAVRVARIRANAALRIAGDTPEAEEAEAAKRNQALPLVYQ